MSACLIATTKKGDDNERPYTKSVKCIFSREFADLSDHKRYDMTLIINDSPAYAGWAALVAASFFVRNDRSSYSPDMKSRSIVYIDGFNLYYGSVRGTRHKWLDLQLLFERLRQDDEIQSIKYFTAEVTGRQLTNQKTYLHALISRPKIDIILGRYKQKQIRCGVRACSFQGSKFFQVSEEKRTDVSIACHMLDDAYQDRADRFVLVSGDSDLVPPIHMIKRRFPDKHVIVYVPARDETRGAATELRGAADKHRTLPQVLIERSQLQPKIPDGDGGWLHKPSGW